jgi:cytochrome c556
MLKKATVALCASAIAATAVFADGHAGPYDGQIKARKALMQLYGHNMGILGGMARGKMEYDADAASAAAGNLAALATINQMSMWPAGSDSFDNDNTRALPDICENFADVGAKGAAFSDAAIAMAAAAGNGLESLQAAMGPLGGSCGSCHKAYRKPE